MRLRFVCGVHRLRIECSPQPLSASHPKGGHKRCKTNTYVYDKNDFEISDIE